jgi:hypothetical protein
VWAGFKYTIGLVLIVLILFIAGFFITGHQPNDGTQLNKYIRVRPRRDLLSPDLSCAPLGSAFE